MGVTLPRSERLFLVKYLLNDNWDAMRPEFFNLKQGFMTVIEYETKLLPLALFATAQLTDYM